MTSRLDEGLTTDVQYANAVGDLKLFLDGKTRDLTRDLKARMETASEELEFERMKAASKIPDYIPAFQAGRAPAL